MRVIQVLGARHAPLVLLTLLLAAVPQNARAGGAGENVLAMTVTVDTRPGAAGVDVRAGGVVVKRYRLVNRGEADLYGVGVGDRGVPGGRVSCPRRTLHALRSMICTARFRALPGRRIATARAGGEIPSLGRRVTATARSGYEGVAGALGLTEAVRVTGGRAVVTYTVTNRGNRPVYGLRLSDPLLGPVACATELAPGVSAGCTATVRRPPGTYRSAGLVSGSDRVTTVDEHGGRVPAPPLTARATAAFTIAAPPPRRPHPQSARPSVPVPTRAGAAPGAPPVSPSVPPSVLRTRPPGTGAAPGTGVGAAPGAPGTLAAPAVPGAVSPAAAAAAAAAEAAAEALGEAAAAAAAEALAAPGAVPPEAAPGGAVPPGAAGRQPPADTAAVPRPPSAARPPVAAGEEGILPRLHRRARELPHLGMTVVLLLLLVPAAAAAALLGSRRS
ncbi:hypothetical protein [Streptomyces sp. NPDC003943]